MPDRANAHREELLQVAKQRRLAQTITIHRKEVTRRHSPIHAHILAQTGAAMTDFGHQLQERYSGVVDIPSAPILTDLGCPEPVQ